jgi:15-cis-phytoene desaturase
MLTILNPIKGSTDRVLDGPTNLVWIDPWRTYLESAGVRYVREAKVEEILCDQGLITGVAVRQQGKRTVVQGDHYVAALRSNALPPC